MKLISDRYRRLNEAMHRAPKGTGASGHRFAPIVAQLIRQYGVKSMLDYGCGQQTLRKRLKKEYREIYAGIHYDAYDPAIPKLAKIPEDKVDLVVCTDVMEHIEPKFLDNVFAHIRSLARTIVLFNIATIPANKRLPTGENAHLIIWPCDWWMDYITGQWPGYPMMRLNAHKKVHKNCTLLLEVA